MLRAYCEQDLNRVMEIWLACSITAHNFIEQQHWKELYATVMKEYIPYAKTTVYEENGIVQGFLSKMGEHHIGALFVFPDRQGQGIGSKLLCDAQKHQSQLTLSVYTENEKACRFYKRHGFTILCEEESDFIGHLQYQMMWKKTNPKEE